MRLREMKRKLLDAKDGIQSLIVEPTGNSTKVINLDHFLKAIKKLKEIETLDFVIDPILDDGEIGGHYINKFNISNNAAATLNNNYKQLVDAFELLTNILDKMVNPQPDFTLSVKLYDLDEFGELSDLINNFQKRVLSPLNFLSEKTFVGELEAGSRWINITLGSFLALKLLTGVVSASFDILTHDYQKYLVAAELVKQYEKQNNDINDFRNFLEKQVEEVYINRASLLIESIKNDTSINEEERSKLNSMKEEQINELRISLIKSMEETTKQIDKGLEIYTTLDKPIEDRFQIELPDFSKLLSLRKQGKLLSHGDTTKDQTNKKGSKIK